MIKALLLGIWLCAVTLGSAYGVVSWQKSQQAAKAAEAAHAAPVLEQMQTKLINVPIIADGAVQGYVLAQFAFSVDSNKLKELSTKPDLILIDEAFKLIYAGEAVDFRHMRKTDVGALSKIIQTNVNKRLGQEIVRDVLIQQLNYLPRDQLRSHG
jgi:flagellar basal body-associated protein FliL